MGVHTDFAGNLVADPELRYTQSGVAVLNMRVAANDRVRDQETGEWRQGPSTFVTVTVWRRQAENLAESLAKGDQVLVIGELAQREYQTREGEKRTAYEVLAEHVGVGLSYATARPVANSDRMPQAG